MTEKPEFSRPVEIAAVFRDRVDRVIEADAEERKAVAARLGLVDLAVLKAELSLAPWQSKGLTIWGSFMAELSQSCVVTLEPVPARLSVPVEAHFVPEAEIVSSEDETLGDPEAPDPPEPLPKGGVIDLGELVVQHLAVALDPYPRKPGVAFTPPEAGQDPAAASPFAKLEALKRPPKG